MTQGERAQRAVVDFSGKTFSDSEEASKWLRQRFTRDLDAASKETYDDCITIAAIATEPCGPVLAEKLRRRRHQMLECLTPGDCGCHG